MDNKKINEAVKIAEKNFLAGFNCAESALMGMAFALDMKSDLFPRIATGFGGGVSRYGSVCGAISGVIMAMGACCGRDNLDDPNGRQRMQELASSFIEDFKKEYSFIDCHDLTNCDLLTDEGRDKFDNEKIRQQKCCEFVKFAVRKGVETIKNR